LSVAATARERMGGAIGDEALCKTRTYIHREGARRSTRMTTPERLALEACER
jgi:hypothetical protein